MFYKFKVLFVFVVVSVVLSGVVFVGSYVKLFGDFVIFFDMFNFVLCVVMEGMVECFGVMYLDLNIELIVIDCEVYKIQICNFLSVNLLDVVNWYVVNCMKLYVDVGLFEDIFDFWVEEELVDLVFIKGVMILDGK